MLTDLYLQTTDPKLTAGELFKSNIFPKIVASVVLHTVIYAAFLNMASYIFTGKMLSSAVNMRLISVLCVIMFFGFFARFYHVKEIDRAYKGDADKVREHLDKLYIGWIFLS
jgi:hypothetical protein